MYTNYVFYYPKKLVLPSKVQYNFLDTTRGLAIYKNIE